MHSEYGSEYLVISQTIFGILKYFLRFLALIWTCFMGNIQKIQYLKVRINSHKLKIPQKIPFFQA